MSLMVGWPAVRWLIVGMAVLPLMGCVRFMGGSDTGTEVAESTTGPQAGATAGVSGDTTTAAPSPSTAGSAASGPVGDGTLGTTGTSAGTQASSSGQASDVGDCDATVRVLFLDDEAPHVSEINAVLEAAGIEVRNAGRYDEWDGVQGLDADTDVVLYLNGWNYQFDLTAAGHAAIEAFVMDGGRLVRTEWTAWEQGSQGGDATDHLLPVDYAGSFTSGTQWQVALPGHALADGLGAQPWTEASSCSRVSPRVDAEVVVRSGACGPAVTVWDVGAGSSVHINSTFDGFGDSPMLQQVLVNAVRVYTGCDRT